MTLTKFAVALELSKNKFLLPVSVVQLTTLILAKGVAAESIKNRLHHISLHHWCQTTVLTTEASALKSLVKFQDIFT